MFTFNDCIIEANKNTRGSEEPPTGRVMTGKTKSWVAIPFGIANQNLWFDFHK